MVAVEKFRARTMFTFPSEGTYPNGSSLFLYKNVRIIGNYNHGILSYNGSQVAVIKSGDDLNVVLTDMNGKSIGGLIGACYSIFKIDVIHDVGEEVSVEYDSMEPMENCPAEYLLNGSKIIYEGHGAIKETGVCDDTWLFPRLNE